MHDFGSYINAMDVDYDSENVSFFGYVHKLNTPQFFIVKRSAYAKGNIYMKENVDYPFTKLLYTNFRNVFIKCNNYFTNKEFTEDFRHFIRSESDKSGVKTSHRI